VLTNGSRLPETRRSERWSEPTASGACNVGGVSFRGRREAAASGGGGGISAGGGGGINAGGGSGRRRGGVCFGPAPPAEKTREDARGVAWLDSTPTRRVLECFVGPFPAKTGPPNSSLVF
jgi:hypothetical protein